MNANQTMKLVLELPSYKGKYIGFFHSGGKTTIRGWWRRSNGSEGGELTIDAESSDVLDFDGCYDLPKYVYDELAEWGIKDPFAEDDNNDAEWQEGIEDKLDLTYPETAQQ